MQLLREERVVVHFPENSEMPEAYVTAPDEPGDIHAFPMLCAHGGEGWHRTSIDSLTLSRHSNSTRSNSTPPQTRRLQIMTKKRAHAVHRAHTNGKAHKRTRRNRVYGRPHRQSRR